MTGTNILSTSPKHIPRTTTSSRALSPVRSRAPLSTSQQQQRMPSPRAPAARPQSPLSPRFESNRQFESLPPPSQRSMNARSGGNSQRRAATNTLKLPSLPRFHPANFPSTHSSAQTTPDSTVTSPPPPSSPRSHQRVISDAQKQLLHYQREMISAAARSSTPTQFDNPVSPRLVPMGSPGPVTPLELEDGESYLVAGVRKEHGAVPSDELVEKLIKEEASRQRRLGSPSRTATAAGR